MANESQRLKSEINSVIKDDKGPNLIEKSTNYAKPQFQQVYSKKQNSIEHVLNIDDFSPLSNALTPMNLITNKFGFRNDALLGIVKGS